MHFLVRNIHWLVRIVVAAIFLVHGLYKLPADQFAQNFGLSLPVAYLVAIGEIVIAIAVFFGGLGSSWLTRFGGLIMVIIMIGAIVIAKWNGAWMAMEIDVLLLVLGLFFLVRGNQGLNH
jgi:uncharacterized membrane protein YphA (DoxX/SURF4 family)